VSTDLPAASLATAAESIVSLPRSRAATAAVPAMFGFRMPPMPGVHRGLPSPYLTLVFSLSGALPIHVPDAQGVRSGSFRIPVGGLHTRPVLLPQPLSSTVGDDRPSGSGTGWQRGIQLAVHPLASRALFGMPASELTGEVLELDEIVGRQGGVLREQLTGPVDPLAAAGLVFHWIEKRLTGASVGHPSAELRHAWQLIVSSGGRCRIGDVARDVGWSRRHLTASLKAETGLGAKDLARVTRFQLARSMLVDSRPALSTIAADCGYTDQSHLTAEWREFAGCTPGQWIAQELPALSGHRHAD
jgi:AraC-like DNA-binding protein